jgi:surface antigen
MQGWATSGKLLCFLSIFAASCQIAAPPANAVPSRHYRQSIETSHHSTWAAGHALRVTGRGRVMLHGRYHAHGGLSCVPFARSDSGIDVAGNAWEWWDNAAGVYARGAVPESGSVLTFRANGRMRLGHVAVVSRVINPREVEVDHANWWGPGMYGGVARNIPVVDVSEANDWTAVRVGLGEPGQFGSVYPTYGFIYDRPDTGVMVAARATPAPQPELNPAPNDLRPANERGWQTYEEVADAPVVTRRHKYVAHLSSKHLHQVAALERRQ